MFKKGDIIYHNYDNEKGLFLKYRDGFYYVFWFKDKNIVIYDEAEKRYKLRKNK